MRNGADYRDSLRDGRKVWVLGEGAVDDITTHPATSAMVDEYVAWYDRHFDQQWRDKLFAPEGKPWAYNFPTSAEQLVAMGRAFSATTFLNAGNITHTPAYGHLISLGILVAVQEGKATQPEIDTALAYRAHIAETGRFLTFSSGAPTIGARMRPDPADRAALKITRETDAGLTLSGRVGMHTSPAFAEDVYIGALCGVPYQGRRASFVVPVGAPGVTTICRKMVQRHANPFIAPLSRRFDELDGQMWLQDVFVPWERVFLVDESPEPIARWLFWHQLYCWLSKAEFTLGLAFACTHALGLVSHAPSIEHLLDIMTEVQTVRACLTAAERDPQFTADGYCYPNHNHIAAGSIAMLKARPRISELMRILPGSSIIVSPSDTDLASPEVGPGLDESFAGGGYTALQRTALLQMAWDHVSTELDGRESAFELHANGGIPAWRGRLRRSFDRYNELANAVLKQLSVEMPPIDLSSIAATPLAPRRIVDPNAAAPKGTTNA